MLKPHKTTEERKLAEEVKDASVLLTVSTVVVVCGTAVAVWAYFGFGAFCLVVTAAGLVVALGARRTLIRKSKALDATRKAKGARDAAKQD